MRRHLPLALALALAGMLPALPAVASGERLVPVTSRIAAVTVYPDRAQVTRTASVSLPAGTYRVRFDRLPADLDADSVRVSAVGTARAELHGFDLETAYLGEATSKQTADFETRLAVLNDRDRALSDQRDVHARQLALLQSTASQSGTSLAHELSIGKAKLSEWRDLLGFLQTQQLQEARAIQGVDREHRGIERDRKALQAKLEKLRGFRRQAVRQIPVTVEVTRGGTLDLALEYVVEGASWSPLYDAHLNGRGDQLDWRYQAQIVQETGEDWRDVALKLSTAHPAAGSTPPTPSSWFLSFFQPLADEDRRNMAPAPQAMEAPSPPRPGGSFKRRAKADGAAGSVRAVERHTSVSDEGTSVTLDVPRLASIPSDGQPHQTFVGEANFPATPGYRVVPRETANAFLEVRAKHVGPWPLLPGPVRAFVGHDYVGTTPIGEELVAGQSFDLPMGVDRAIQVKRQRLAKQQGERGLLHKVSFADYRYEVTLANFKPAAQTLTVLESVPQSTEETIAIKPATANYPSVGTDEPGQLKWVFKLQPSEKKVLKWGYQVEYPTGTSLAGLE